MSVQRPTKRQRIASVAASSGCTRAELSRILEGLRDSSDSDSGVLDRRSIGLSVSDCSRAETPYGTVVKQLNCGSRSLPYICPFAFLFHVCSRSARFADLLRSSVGAGRGRMVMYVDEMRPGNVLRPDKGRSTQCVYWTLTNFPEYVRSRDTGWFTAMVVRSSVVGDLPGKVCAADAFLWQ